MKRARPLTAADENADTQMMGVPATQPAPTIDASNAAAFMPPSLNSFRTAASRAEPDSAPAECQAAKALRRVVLFNASGAT